MRFHRPHFLRVKFSELAANACHCTAAPKIETARDAPARTRRAVPLSTIRIKQRDKRQTLSQECHTERHSLLTIALSTSSSSRIAATHREDGKMLVSKITVQNGSMFLPVCHGTRSPSPLHSTVPRRSCEAPFGVKFHRKPCAERGSSSGPGSESDRTRWISHCLAEGKTTPRCAMPPSIAAGPFSLSRVE